MPQSDSAKRTGFGVLPWAAVALFAAVGVGITLKLLASLSAGRMMAFLLELVFAILWLLIATAYVVDLKQGKNRQGKNRPGKNRPGRNQPGRNQPGRNKSGKPRPAANRDRQLGSRG